MTGIFKENDIRGEFGKDLTLDITKKLGVALQKFSESKKIVIAYDNRLSTKKLRSSLIYGINGTVIDLGLVPTPLFYYYMSLHKNSYGIMITASHLPKQFNGFKLQKGTFALTYSTGIKQIEKTILKINKVNKGKNKIIRVRFDRKYINWITSKIKLKRRVVVAIDGANGVAGLFFVKAAKKLRCKVLPLYVKPDGNFPHHIPNPLLNETLKDLQKLIKKDKADLGIALDQDGDRLRLLSNNGAIIDNEVLISLLSRDLLSKKPKSKIVYSIICSDLVRDYIKLYKGIPIVEKVGHSNIKNRMIKENADLSGEFSGHIGFKENYYNDDGIFAGLKVIELVSKNNSIWHEAFRLSKIYITPPETRLNMDKVSQIKTMAYLDKYFKHVKKSRKDGLKLYFNGGWALVRPSKTESVLSIRFQAMTKLQLKIISNLVNKQIKKALKPN